MDELTYKEKKELLLDIKGALLNFEELDISVKIFDKVIEDEDVLEDLIDEYIVMKLELHRLVGE